MPSFVKANRRKATKPTLEPFRQKQQLEAFQKPNEKPSCGLKHQQEQLRDMDGVTGVIKSEDGVRAKMESGWRVDGTDGTGGDDCFFWFLDGF